jgi:hypothetical protein
MALNKGSAIRGRAHDAFRASRLGRRDAACTCRTRRAVPMWRSRSRYRRRRSRFSVNARKTTRRICARPMVLVLSGHQPEGRSRTDRRFAPCDEGRCAVRPRIVTRYDAPGSDLERREHLGARSACAVESLVPCAQRARDVHQPAHGPPREVSGQDRRGIARRSKNPQPAHAEAAPPARRRLTLGRTPEASTQAPQTAEDQTLPSRI